MKLKEVHLQKGNTQNNGVILNTPETYPQMFDRVKNKGESAFIPFVMAGDPDFETSLQIVKTYVENGADALEIGFPFSDPVADGPTVQEADSRALNSGMTAKRGFKFIKKVREFTNIPIGILVYYNLIFKMGIEEFYRNASESGVNGVLSADLPPEEAGKAVTAARKFGVDPIFMAAQTTSNERLNMVNELCGGFLYVVAVMGVTGARSQVQTDTVQLISRIKKHSKLPQVVGFGISNAEHVKEIIRAGSDGVIVASALLDLISENLQDKKVMLQKIAAFTRELKEATKKINPIKRN